VTAATRPLFISFEGGEGAGKSTQARMLAEALQGRGLDVLLTREPGGTPEAEAIRSLLLGSHGGGWSPRTETLLHVAARCQHLEGAIRPALAAGRWVITDRFADSTLVYQGCGQGVDPEWIVALDALVVGDDGPDLTIVLDLDPQTAAARLASRGGDQDRYERMGDPFHRRVREGFLAIARATPDRCRLIDAGATPEAVHAAVVIAVGRFVADRTGRR
jgi:thymidylate kinase